MNIRSVSNPLLVKSGDKIEAERRDLKSDQTTDRDGNGQQAYGDNDSHRPLTEEELKTVVEKLKQHEGISKHGLNVLLTLSGDRPVVTIEDNQGKIIKRLTERHLFEYLFQDESEPLSLVRRTA